MTAPRGTEPETPAGSVPPRGPDAASPADRLEGGPAAGGGAPAGAVPRAGGPRAAAPGDSSPGWAAARPAAPAAKEDPQATTVLPDAAGRPARPAPARPAPARSAPARPAPRGDARPPTAATTRPTTRTRRARLSLRRIDPWSVFVFSLIAAVFLGVALVVAVAVLYAVLGTLGVTGSLNQLFAEVTGGSATSEPLFTTGRIVGGAAVLAAVNVVLLTLLATLGALLYNLCASFTGGVELTLGERD